MSLWKWKLYQKSYFKHGWKKPGVLGDIPVGILKGCVDWSISVLAKTINITLEKVCFSDQYLQPEVTAAFKKKYELIKENYLPV